MLLFLIIGLFGYVVATIVTPSVHEEYIDTQRLTWQLCIPAKRIYCANLTVPLDYMNNGSSSTVVLDLIKVPARNLPSRGGIVFNFGGPGIGGWTRLIASSDELLNKTGGHHDLVSFNPRGTGRTLPLACQDNDFDVSMGKMFEAFQSISEISSQSLLTKLWSEGEAIADSCFGPMAGIGSFVGTTSVARDVHEIARALDGDKLLRYYGFSYGTILGATVASLFPEIVDRMVLNGPANYHEWYQSYGDPEQLSDIESVWRRFLSACIEQSYECKLSALVSSASELERTIDDCLESIRLRRTVFEDSTINYMNIKKKLFFGLYSPVIYPRLADLLYGVLTHNETLVSADLATIETADFQFPWANHLAIRCSDKRLQTNNPVDLQAEVDQLLGHSKRFYEFPLMIMVICARWRFKGAGQDVWNISKSIDAAALVIGTSNDPVTPLISARKLSQSFSHSALLQVNGTGHTTAELKSTCADIFVAKYFLNGKLPEPGMICQADFQPFQQPLMYN